jgi:tRNA-binding protein
MSPAPVKPPIDPKLLEQLDVRVGTIEAVLDITGSDKLVQLRVRFGDHTRTVVAGLKQERADPREIEGKQALFVVNLPPRRIRGVTSEGMLFDIGYADGITPVLAVPESPCRTAPAPVSKIPHQ